jgi:hypothetical protein
VPKKYAVVSSTIVTCAGPKIRVPDLNTETHVTGRIVGLTSAGNLQIKVETFGINPVSPVPCPLQSVYFQKERRCCSFTTESLPPHYSDDSDDAITDAADVEVENAQARGVKVEDEDEN